MVKNKTMDALEGPYFHYSGQELNNVTAQNGVLFLFYDFMSPSPPTANINGDPVHFTRLQLRFWTRLYHQDLNLEGNDHYRVVLFRVKQQQSAQALEFMTNPENFLHLFDQESQPAVQHPSVLQAFVREDEQQLFDCLYDRVIPHRFIRKDVTSINVASGGETVPDSQNPQFSSTTWQNKMTMGALEIPTYNYHPAYLEVDIPIGEDIRFLTGGALYPSFMFAYVMAGESVLYPPHTANQRISFVTCTSKATYYMKPQEPRVSRGEAAPKKYKKK